MSRLNQIEELMSNPEYDGHAHFLVDTPDILMGTSNTNELFLLYHYRRAEHRNFLPHEYVVHLLSVLAGFSEF